MFKCQPPAPPALKFLALHSQGHQANGGEGQATCQAGTSGCSLVLTAALEVGYSHSAGWRPKLGKCETLGLLLTPGGSDSRL